MNNCKFVYFGGEPLGLPVLNQLFEAGFVPDLIVTNPDRPQGRKMISTPPPLQVWANEKGIELSQPENLKDPKTLSQITNTNWDLFIVVAYSQIIPQWLINLPTHNTLNLHPSLLPKYRGPSPIRSAILADDKDTGATIIQLDEKMDHGPIVAQAELELTDEDWPMLGRELDRRLTDLGGQLLITILPSYLEGKISPLPQDHTKATFTKKISKTDGELKIDSFNLPAGSEARTVFLKICAYEGWPETFFIHEGKRIKINQAELSSNGQLRILRITPEGKKEQDFIF